MTHKATTTKFPLRKNDILSMTISLETIKLGGENP